MHCVAANTLYAYSMLAILSTRSVWVVWESDWLADKFELVPIHAVIPIQEHLRQLGDKLWPVASCDGTCCELGWVTNLGSERVPGNCTVEVTNSNVSRFTLNAFSIMALFMTLYRFRYALWQFFLHRRYVCLH